MTDQRDFYKLPDACDTLEQLLSANHQDLPMMTEEQLRMELACVRVAGRLGLQGFVTRSATEFVGGAEWILERIDRIERELAGRAAKAAKP